MVRQREVPDSAESDKPSEPLCQWLVKHAGADTEKETAPGERARTSSTAVVSEWGTKLEQFEKRMTARHDAEQAQLDAEARDAEVHAARLRSKYERWVVKRRAQLAAGVAASEARQRLFASTLTDIPDDHPAVPGLMELLRGEERIIRMLRGAEQSLEEQYHMVRGWIAQYDKLRADIAAAPEEPLHVRILVLGAAQERRRILRQQWEAEDLRWKQESLARRLPRLRVTTITVRALPRGASRRPGSRGRRASRAHRTRAPASASGSSNGDGRPPPPPPPSPPSSIDAHTLLVGLQVDLRRPVGRPLAQQIFAKLWKIDEEPNDDPNSRDVRETIAWSHRHVAEHRHCQRGERL